jgi:hypothetical protein
MASKVTLKLSCAGNAACSGIHITETTVEVLREPGNKLVAVIASASKSKTSKRPVHVANVKLRLNAGRTKTITLTPNRKGKVLLAHFGKLPVAITVTMTTAGKTTTVKTAHATLHLPKKPPHRHA